MCSQKPCCVFFSQTHKRTHDEAFEEDDDDDWIFDPTLDEVMTQFGGGNATTSRDPLLDFQLRPVGARRNCRNVLNKQRFEATLQQHRDITPDDDLGEELTHALRRSIERQIASNPSLTPHSTVHFAMQSSTFTHAFQSTTFTVREFEEVNAWTRISRPSRPNSIPTKTLPPTIPSLWTPLSYSPQVLAAETANDTNPVPPPCVVLPKGHTLPSRTKRTSAAPEPSSP